MGSKFARSNAKRAASVDVRVRLAELLVVVLAAIVNSADATAGQADAYTAQLGDLINGYRAQHALPPLAVAEPLTELAHEHAQHMARENRLSHDGFQQRFEKARSPACVENVGSHHRSPEAEFDAWRDSATHARNLLDPRVTRMGIAIEGRYVAFLACR